MTQLDVPSVHAIHQIGHPLRVIAVVGARPNFMKIAPLLWEAQNHSDLQVTLVHTGQHYDRQMSDLFFEQLRIPKPDVSLGVGSGSHAVQTAEVMKRFEPVVTEYAPHVVVVVGDVNSTLAAAIVAVKMGVPVAHVEAGLRSFDRTMPEEINRILTDSISRWLFVSERSGVANLAHEGIADDRVHFVGNVMIDTLFASRKTIEQSTILTQLNLQQSGYGVITLHRPSNVDDPNMLRRLLDVFCECQKEFPLIFPVHPRTAKQISQLLVGDRPNLRFIEPLGYLDFMKLVGNSRIVLTDSGGIQEETTALGVPCLTLRSTTERPVTVECGSNQLVGANPDNIAAAWRRALDVSIGPRQLPELWDGNAAKRIIQVLRSQVRQNSRHQNSFVRN